jgi:hypothetical protein
MRTDISIEYPELPLFSQPAFSHPDWEPFASAVRAGEARGDIPEHKLLRRAMSELIQELAARHAAMASSLNALINGQIPITVQCQGTGFIGGQQPAQIVPAASAAQLQVSMQFLYLLLVQLLY